MEQNIRRRRIFFVVTPVGDVVIEPAEHSEHAHQTKAQDHSYRDFSIWPNPIAVCVKVVEAVDIVDWDPGLRNRLVC